MTTDAASALLVAVARAFIGIGDLEAVRSRAEDVRDWRTAFRTAENHGMLPISCSVLGEAAAPGADPQAQQRLVGFRRDAMVESLRLEAEASAVLSALSRRGVRPIVLKGIALARTLYPDPSLRPFGDLDLLVDESRWADVRLTMLGLGAKPDGSDTPALPPRLTEHDALDHHFAFVTTGGLRVECAFDPLQLGLRTADHEGFRERAVPFPLPQVPDALTLSPEDDLVMLLVHLNRHGFRRLVWFVDIARLLATRPDLDWGLIEGLARREGIRVPVANSLGCVLRTLDMEAPAGASVLRAPLAGSTLWRRYWRDEDVLAEGLHEGPLVFRKSRGEVPLPRYVSWLAANAVLTGRAVDKGRFAFRKLLPRKAFLLERFGEESAGYARLWLRRAVFRTGGGSRRGHPEQDPHSDVRLVCRGRHHA